MAGTAHAPRTHPREPLVGGVILIGVGLAALAANVFPDVGDWVVLVIGLGLFALFVVTREYGALVPGGIMTGLGAGILASNQMMSTGEDPGGVIVTGLGLGFLSIWLIGLLFRLADNHPWPLVPGGILTAIGIAQLAGAEAVDVGRYWPVALIVIGVVAIGRAVMERRED